MGNENTSTAKFRVINGERIYVGPERRVERRRCQQSDRVERLLKNFGLDRRVRIDRRRQDTSWLVTSQKVVNL